MLYIYFYIYAVKICVVFKRVYVLNVFLLTIIYNYYSILIFKQSTYQNLRSRHLVWLICLSIIDWINCQDWDKDELLMESLTLIAKFNPTSGEKNICKNSFGLHMHFF